MFKKYAPYILLLLAALFLFYVKTHQRGSNKRDQLSVTTEPVNGDEGFNRNPVKIIYTKHAQCRMACRHVSEDDVKEILKNGKLNADKVQQDDRGKTYPLDGKTADDKLIRIVVAPKKTDVVIVTVIDLDRDWPCDCDTH